MSLIYIKHLPKDLLLYELWRHAKQSKKFRYCSEMRPVLTIADAKSDINYMIQNGRNIDMCTYYGRLLYIDITNDYCDVSQYDLYNGYKTAERIIDELKKHELNIAIRNYHKFF